MLLDRSARYFPPQEAVWNEWQSSVDFEISESGTDVSSTLQFVYPVDTEHKQYVNLADNGTDEGMNLTLKVKLENPIEGQTVYWRVTTDANNSKRTEPKQGLKEHSGASLEELDRGIATCSSTVKGGEARALLVCGVAMVEPHRRRKWCERLFFI